MKSLLKIALAAVAALAVLVPAFSVFASGASFPDIEGHWAEEYIELLYGKGIIAGMGDGTFQPDERVTTAEFITMVIKSIDGPAERTGSHWASGYVNAALGYDIIGDFELNSLDRPVVRRIVATIGHKALLNIFNEADEPDTTAAHRLSDLEDCASCIPHVSQFYVKCIMIGRTSDRFYGNEYLTRAEAAIVIIKMLDADMREPQTLGPDEGVVGNGGQQSGLGEGEGNGEGEVNGNSEANGEGTAPSLVGHENDAAIFAELYPVSENHPFVISTYNEVVARFETGTGIIAFAFPACPRCKNAFPVLEKAFYEMKLDENPGLDGKILYYNILDDRTENNARYQTFVSYTKDFLPTDDNGNPRIYSPDIFFVKSGVIVGNHLDTVESLTDPTEPLNEEQAAELLQIYIDLIEKMGTGEEECPVC